MWKTLSVQIQGQPKRVKWMGVRDQSVSHTVMLLGGGERNTSGIESVYWLCDF